MKLGQRPRYACVVAVGYTSSDGARADHVVRQGADMSKKTAQPALYEMMRGRPGGSAPPPVMEQPEAESSPFAGFDFSQWLSPGRTVRLPVGYMFLIAALAVVLIWFAYMVGAKRGQTIAKLSSDEAVV